MIIFSWTLHKYTPTSQRLPCILRQITAGDPEKVPSVDGLTRLAVESYEQLEDTLQAVGGLGEGYAA